MKAKTSLTTLVAFMLLLSAVLFFCRQEKYNPGKPTPHVDMKECVDDLPEEIRAALNDFEAKMYSCSEYGPVYVGLLNGIKEINDTEKRRLVARICASLFLEFKLENDTVVKTRIIADRYARYILDFDRILRETNISDEFRIDFLFDALAVYREYCCKPIPNEEMIKDFREWNDWANAIYRARCDLLSNLKQIEHDMFGRCLHGIDVGKEGEVIWRLVDFHIATVRDVKEQDAFQRKHKRRPPKLLVSYPADYERLSRNLSPVIRIGDNEIDTRKWEAGGKEEIIADILAKEKKTKESPQRRPDEVEVQVDGLDQYRSTSQNVKETKED